MSTEAGPCGNGALVPEQHTIAEQVRAQSCQHNKNEGIAFGKAVGYWRSAITGFHGRGGNLQTVLLSRVAAWVVSPMGRPTTGKG